LALPGARTAAVAAAAPPYGPHVTPYGPDGPYPAAAGESRPGTSMSAPSPSSFARKFS
jgi:hypothetical protein